MDGLHESVTAVCVTRLAASPVGTEGALVSGEEAVVTGVVRRDTERVAGPARKTAEDVARTGRGTHLRTAAEQPIAAHTDVVARRAPGHRCRRLTDRARRERSRRRRGGSVGTGRGGDGLRRWAGDVARSVERRDTERV